MINTLAKVWASVSKRGHGGCWLWLRPPMSNGYGELQFLGKRWLIHRFIFTLLVGAIPEGAQVDHKCNNKMCVNPKHLRLATHAQNQINKGITARNTSGLKGASWCKERRKWKAQCRFQNVNHYIGRFSTAKEAHDAYCAYGRKLQGEFFNAGDT